jgi:hypothetical protein
MTSDQEITSYTNEQYNYNSITIKDSQKTVFYRRVVIAGASFRI